MKLSWNDGWFFCETFSEELLIEDIHTPDMKAVRLPHSVTETPFNYFSEQTYQKVSGYKKSFHAPLEWQDKLIRCHFDGVGHEATVFINGASIFTHTGGYTAFSVELNKHLVYGKQNELVLKVDSRETLNCPPFGYVIDYMTYGGIYRDVFLEVLNASSIEDVFYYTTNLLNTDRTLHVQTTLSLSAMNHLNLYKLRFELVDKQGQAVLQRDMEALSLERNKMGEDESLIVKIALPEVILWDLSTPYVYQLKVSLTDMSSQDKTTTLCDEKHISCGFREAFFDARGFWLNGQLVKLRGLNRHQSYPYVGYAMPKRPQVLDAHIMKHELHLNAVRTAHYPQSKHFIEACDQLGLLVFTEIPGWQHIGDQTWQDRALTQVEEMVTQYRNHPSIVLWGVRINESADHHPFYEKTNACARRLDPSRQTGGARHQSR